MNRVQNPYMNRFRAQFVLTLLLCSAVAGAQEAGFKSRFLRNVIRKEGHHPATQEQGPRSILSLSFARGEEPLIDGKLDDAAWKDQRRYMGAFTSYAGGESPSRTEAWIGHSGADLIVAVRCEEKMPDKMKLTTGPAMRDNPKLWAEDCVELFLDTNNDQNTHFQIMINARGAITDSASHKDNGFADGLKHNLRVRAATSRGTDHWSLEVALNLADLGIGDLASVSHIGFNILREKQTPPVGYPIWSAGGNGKAPELFGRLLFPGGTLKVQRVDPGEALTGANMLQALVANHSATEQKVGIRLTLNPGGEWRYTEEAGNRIVYATARTLADETYFVKSGEERLLKCRYDLPADTGRTMVKLGHELAVIGDDGRKTVLQSGAKSLWIPRPVNFFWERSYYYDFEPRLRGIARLNVDRSIVTGGHAELTLRLNGNIVLRKNSDTVEDGSMRTWVFEIDRAALSAGEYIGTVTVVDKAGATLAEASAGVSCVEAPSTMRVPERRRIPLVINDALPEDKPGVPVTFGVPFPRGQLRRDTGIRVVDEKGKVIPSQTQAVAFWNEGGSVRWLHVDIQPDIVKQAPKQYFIEFGKRVKTRKHRGISVRRTERTITVDTGVVQAEFDTGSGQLIDRVRMKRKLLLQGGSHQYLVDNKGVKWRSNVPGAETETTVEVNGPMRVVICRKGWYANGEDRRCQYIARFHFFKGKADVKLVHTFIFTEDSDKVWLKDLALVLSPDLDGGNRKVTFASGRGVPAGTAEDAELEALLAGDKVAAAERAVARKQVVGPWTLDLPSAGEGQGVCMVQDVFKHFGQPESHFGVYRTGQDQSSATVAEGEVAGNGFGVADGRHGISVVVRDMPRLFPKELEATGKDMRIHLWSNRGGADMDFRTPALAKFWGKEFVTRNKGVLGQRSQALGMARSHDITIRFHAGSTLEAGLEQLGRLVDTPVLAIADPEWNCASGVIGSIRHRDPERFPRVEALMEQMIDKVLYNVEDWDNGFFDYGAGPHMGYEDRPNNEIFPTTYRYNNHDYNYHYGLWLDYLRSGDRRYFKHIERYTRYRGDVTVSHVDSETKIIGSHARDTCVHWGGQRGSRIRRKYFSKSDNVDTHLFYFYVTGDRRGLEVARDIAAGAYKLHGYAGFIRDYSEYRWHDRDTFAVLREATALYRAEFDPRMLVMADDAANQLLDLSKAAGVLTRKFQGGGSLEKPTVSHEWSKIVAVLDFYGFTRRPGVLESAKRLIRHWAQRKEGFHPFHYGGRSSHAFAHGYYTTRDPMYLAMIRHLLNNGLKQAGNAGGAYAQQYLPARKRLFGVADMSSWTIDLPYAMAALAGFDGALPVFPFSPSGAGTELYFVKNAGQPIQFGILGGGDNPPTLLDGEGRKVAGVDVEKYPYSYNYHTVRIPADIPAGVYTLKAGAAFAVTFPGKTLHKAVRSIEHGLGVNSITGEGRWYFLVPAGAERFAMDSGQPDEILLFDPDGARVEPARDNINGFIVDVPPGHAGKLWSVQAEGESYEKGGSVRLVGVHPYAAYGDPSRFFLPRRDGTVKPFEPYTGYDPDAEYIAGVCAKEGELALEVGRKGLSVTCGKDLGDGKYEYFDCHEGTAEMWAWSHQALAAQDARVEWLTLPFPRAERRENHFLHEMRLSGQDGRIGMEDGRSIKGNRVDFYAAAPVLRQAEWSHVVFEWKKVGDQLERTFYFNGKPVGSSPRAWAGCIVMPEWLNVAPGGSSYRGAIDELRISNTRRYNGRPYSLEKARRFEPDANTLLLYHFDGDLKGVTVDGRPGPAAR